MQPKVPHALDNLMIRFHTHPRRRHPTDALPEMMALGNYTLRTDALCTERIQF